MFAIQDKEPPWDRPVEQKAADLEELGANLVELFTTGVPSQSMISRETHGQPRLVFQQDNPFLANLDPYQSFREARNKSVNVPDFLRELKWRSHLRSRNEGISELIAQCHEFALGRCRDTLLLTSILEGLRRLFDRVPEGNGYMLDIITVIRSALHLKPSELTPRKMKAIIQALKRCQSARLSDEHVEEVYDLFESVKLQFVAEPANE